MHPSAFLSPALAARLDALGWSAADPIMTDVLPALVRGAHALVVAPPVPVYATPVLAALQARETPSLLLVPDLSLPAWAAVVDGLSDPSLRPIRIIRTRGDAERAGATADATLVIGAELALACRQRGLLPLEQFGAVLLAWPETWGGDGILADLLADAPADQPRAILASTREAGEALAERYARRPVMAGTDRPAVLPLAKARVVETTWTGRIGTVAEVVAAIGNARAVIWTRDRSLHAAIRQGLAGTGAAVDLVTDPATSPGIPVIAFDLPDAEHVGLLGASGDLVLLVPPGLDLWPARLGLEVERLTLPMTSTAARELQRRRTAIDHSIRTDGMEAGLLAVAPLIERHGAALVAAALYKLWTSIPTATAHVPPPGAGGQADRVWIGVGRRDNVSPNDLVGILLNDLRLEKARVGKIDIRETFTLVEIGGGDAERVAEQLMGKMLKGRRLIARMDKGQTEKGRGDRGRPGRGSPRR